MVSQQFGSLALFARSVVHFLQTIRFFSTGFGELWAKHHQMTAYE
tara:strand:- start:3857 stop:3991 length:135 start_codon:yes stop_codon:yes gene_type:complete